MKSGRWLLAMLSAVLAFGLSGCSLNVESFLQPPRVPGEQQAIQAALDTYIRDSGGGRYTLQYPAEGEYTSAFVLCDSRGAPLTEKTELAQSAFVFYRLSTAEEVHINLLRRGESEWVSVGDCTGFGSRVLQVAFGDLDGDGTMELLTGWDTYNSREHSLVVFSSAAELEVLSKRFLYSGLYVGRLDSGERDSLLLFRIGAENRVTVSLARLEEKELVEAGTASMDGYIQQLGSMQACTLKNGVRGVYVDATRGNGTVVTELVLCEYGQLKTPFYNAATNATEITARASGFACRDVNGDGTMEVPRCRLLAGYEAGESLPDYAFLAVWRAWNYDTGTWSDQLYTVENREDGYRVTLDETVGQAVRTAYDTATRTLSFFQGDETRAWLKLCVADILPEQAVWLYEPEEERLGCAAFFDENEIPPERVRYMVTWTEG